MGYKSVPSAAICVAPVEEGQQGAVGEHLPSHPQPVAAVQLTAQRDGEVGGELEVYGSWKVTQPGQCVIVRGPPFLEIPHG